MGEVLRIMLTQGLCNLVGVGVGVGYGMLTVIPRLSDEARAWAFSWVIAATIASYALVPVALLRLFGPVGRALRAIEETRDGALDTSPQVARRALDMPILAGLVSTITWFVAALTFVPFAALDPVPWEPLEVLHIAMIAVLVGAVSSVFVFYLVEARVRGHVLPRLLPDGRLADKGARRIPIQLKLVVLLLMTSTLPVSVLCVAALGGVASAEVVLFLGAAFLVIGLLQAWFIGRSINTPLVRLRRKMAAVQKGELEVSVPVVSLDDVGRVSEGFNAMIEGLRQGQFVKETFGRYVTEQVLEEILSGRVTLGGEERTATILFSDIRGFTALSERLGADGVVRFLNAYLDVMVDVLVEHGGTIDKFIGDAIMASFGVPVSAEDDAQRAVRAAVAMVDRLEAFNAERRGAGEAEVDVGIGLHTGTVVAGTIGSRKKMEYTVIGDTVNTTSRIEQLNKQLGTRLLISDATYQLTHEQVEARRHGPIQVKGKREPIVVWEVLGWLEHPGRQPTAEM